MQLKVLGSSSSGNCYILENENEALILELGLPFLEVKKAIDFNISKIVGCLLTHEHGDHAKHTLEYLKAGIPVFCSQGTKEAIKVGNHQPSVCFHTKRFQVGNFEIMPFDVIHDAAQPFGFIIKHPQCGKILFLTDTYYCEYQFPGLNHLLIEANYESDILEINIQSGRISPSMRQRLATSHMSLNTCKELLRANDLSQVMSICLIHLSSGNSNAPLFKSEIQALTGKIVYVADRGLEYNIDLIPFL
jgi:phosphoribosyl 1,2-cyclic phosphodiesterase